MKTVVFSSSIAVRRGQLNSCPESIWRSPTNRSLHQGTVIPTARVVDSARTADRRTEAKLPSRPGIDGSAMKRQRPTASSGTYWEIWRPHFLSFSVLQKHTDKEFNMN